MFTFFWLMIIGLSLVLQAKHIPGVLKSSMVIIRKLKLRHFTVGMVSFLSVIIVSGILFISHPIMQWGWLFNLVGGNTVAEESISQPSWNTALFYSGMMIALSLLAFLLPQLALNEELVFRLPIIDEPWWKIIIYCLGFGLAHMIMGIPLAFALSLSIAGFIFYTVAQRHYDRNSMNDITDDDIDNRWKNIPDDMRWIAVELLTEKKKYDACTEAALVHTAHNFLAFSLMVFSMGVIVAVTVISLV